MDTDVEELVRNKWLKLMFYFEHELSKGEISQATYEDISECLMVIKNYLPQGGDREKQVRDKIFKELDRYKASTDPVKEIITVYGGEDIVTPCYRLRIPVSRYDALREGGDHK